MAALLSFACLVIVIAAPPEPAAANGSEFSMSATSGRAGSVIDIREEDPCPPTPSGFDGQYVQFDFFDANDDKVASSTASVYAPVGYWTSNSALSIPSKQVQQYDPPTYSNDTILGVGVIEAKCVIYIEGVDSNGDPIVVHEETLMEYDSQAFEVTGASPTFIAFPDVIEGGETLSVASSEPCFGEIYASIGNNNAVTNGYEIVSSPNGTWAVDLPTLLDDGMGELTDDPFPPGMYTVGAWCLPTGEIYGFSYSETIVEVVPQQPFNHYVVMGDSYSSGTGAYNYDTESGDCYRSSENYGAYVAAELDLGTPFVTACHGAQTADFYGQNPNTGMPEQLDFLTEATAYVNLTIGGNDAGFGSVMERCVNSPQNTSGWGCATDTSFTDALSDRFEALAGTSTMSAPDNRTITPLAELYEDIADAAPNAAIYVGGYPRLFGSDIADYTANSSAPGSAQCNAPVLASVSYSDAQWLNQQANTLNDVIADAVMTAQNNGVDITFVPATAFTGHGQCDSSSEWIHPVVFDSSWESQPESLHPTSGGYSNGYGLTFAAIMGQ